MSGAENLSSEPEAGLIALRLAGRGLAHRGLLGEAGHALELHVRVDSLDALPAGSGGPHSSIGLPQRVPLWRARGRVTLELVDPTETPPRIVGRGSAQDFEEYQPGDDIEATEVARALALHRLLETLVNDALDSIR